MKPHSLSIHRAILSRLVPVWLVLSLAFGAAAYWLESRRVDANVSDLAAEAALHFDLSADRALFEGDAEQHLPALKMLLHGSQFAAMRLYGRDRKPLLDVREKSDPALDSAIGNYPHEFPPFGSHHHKTLRIGHRLFVQALVPLAGPDQMLFGYFEGIYLVPAQTVQAIEARIRDTLLMVLIVTTLTSLVLYPVIVALNRDTVRLTRSLLESIVELMRVLGSAIAKRDSDTDIHNYRVTLYAIHLAEAMGIPSGEISSLIAGAFLHDVGKIGIPDSILLKAGKLTSEEFDIMKTHVAIGEEIIHESHWLFRAQEVVAHHHERFDGAGYPQGLQGAEIPFNARLFAIVDVFDALTSKRPYKDALPLDQTMEIMRQGSGGHFDPETLSVFERMAPGFLKDFGAADRSLLKRYLAESVDKYFPV